MDMILDDDTYNKLQSITYEDELCHLKTSVSNNSINSVNFELRLYSKNTMIIRMSTQLFKEHIHIVDFVTEYPNLGYGKKMLSLFSDNIIKLFPNIQFISGELSYVDYERWEKLIYLYTNYLPVNRIIINDQPPNTFLSDSKSHKFMNRFKLFLH